MDYVKSERQRMKLHPEMNESWVQSLIANDPSLLGLGDLELRDVERRQRSAGRLDLLLQHPETHKRFEVELQLGETDPSHIVRVLEYWDLEKKKYPQYEHCAVLIAEKVTARFLNVISLFNGFVPLIAIQMQAIKVGDVYSLVFTTVMDQREIGLVDEDIEVVTEEANREYWENKANSKTVAVSDIVLSIAKNIDPSLSLNFTKHYIGFNRNNAAFNFGTVKPRNQFAHVELRLPSSDDVDEILDSTGLDYSYSYGNYGIQSTVKDVEKHQDVFARLIDLAYNIRAGT